MVTEYEIEFPSVIDRVAGGSALANLSFFTVFELGCKARDLDHFDRLIIITFLPICFVVLFTLLSFLMGLRWPCLNEARLAKLHSYRVYPFVATLVTCFLCYSVASSTIVQSFRCVSFDDGSNVLRVDFNVNCDTTR